MTSSSGTRPRTSGARNSGQSALSLEHYGRLVWHRKWLILAVYVLVAGTTAFVAYRLPNVYVSETVILVDPQKVPEAYVKSTVSGDVRNRLGTLSQQILSATRLQRIIDTLNLYPEDRKESAREDVIARMRKDISVNVLSEFSADQDLQAFRIGYSGNDPRLVAQVTNELAALFIEENLKAREQQATGTAEFLNNQLEETRKTLEMQEGKLRDFKLRHVGEMPEQQASTLQLLGQLQSQFQTVNDAINRAEQQKTYLQSMMATQSVAPVVDLDSTAPRPKPAANTAAKAPLDRARARLAGLRARYSEEHPEVRKLRREIEEEEAEQAQEAQQAAAAAPPEPPPERIVPPAVRHYNPVLESQLKALEAELGKQREERARLSRLMAGYQSKLEAIPVREQQMTDLVRDYEISKAHYSQLLEKQLSARTATQLEIRQKGERFTVLDPAQPAERPSRPNRILINLAGNVVGLGLGLILAVGTQFLSVSITAPDQITAATGLTVLEVIPFIETSIHRAVRKRRIIMATVSGLMITALGVAGYLAYRNDLLGL